MVKLFLDSFWPMVLAGIKYSIPMMLISFALGLVVALFVALGRNSKIKIISGICAFYVWIIRGTPLLVQLFIIFYGLPSVGIVFTPFVSAILGLTISQGAYNSEVIRGAIAGIQKGQYEAPKSLGMTKGQTLIHVILPQAALTAVPALANSFYQLAERYVSLLHSDCTGDFYGCKTDFSNSVSAASALHRSCNCIFDL